MCVSSKCFYTHCSLFCLLIKVTVLEQKLREKEGQLTEILLKLQETQKNVSQLQESASMYIT